MELTPTRKFRLAASGALFSAAFLVYMLSGSGPIGPPFRDENMTAGMEPLMLVMQPSVQEELKLTEDQIQKIKETSQAQRNRMPQTDNNDDTPRQAKMGRKHQEAYMLEVLGPQQFIRLKQINLQRVGGLALNNASTAQELGLTEAQRQQTDAILEKLTQQLAQMRGGGFGGGPGGGAEARKLIEDARAAAAKNMLGLLTPEQLAHWNQMLGEPFTGEIGFGRGGQGGGGPGGPGGGPGGPGGGGGPGGPGGGGPGGQGGQGRRQPADLQANKISPLAEGHSPHGPDVSTL